MNKKKIALALVTQIIEDTWTDNYILTLLKNNLAKEVNYRALFALLQQNFSSVNSHIKAADWIHIYSDIDFLNSFRMRKDTFNKLVNIITSKYEPKMCRGDSPVVDINKATLMTLWYLAGHSAMESGAEKFAVCSSTLHREVNYIVDILCMLKNDYIVWPLEEECEDITKKIYIMAGYPDVVGVIGGCLIDILASAKDTENTSTNNTIALQGVCSAAKMFTNISVNLQKDTMTLANSSLFKEISMNSPVKALYTKEYHIVGDNNYPLKTWLITPYVTNRILVNKVHNHKIKTVISIINEAFSYLQGRWQCLQNLKLRNKERASNFVTACCVLHNFCLSNDDIFQQRTSNLNISKQLVKINKDDDLAAREKRDLIANSLYEKENLFG